MKTLNSNKFNALFLLIIIASLISCKKDESKVPSTLTDIDGNIYNVVTIGTQVWLKENLNTITYNDNTPIPSVVLSSQWASMTSDAYFGNIANMTTYGKLYNWYAVNSGKLCPTGWHVPTDSEWTTLTDYLGGESVSGGKLKESGTTHWNSPNTGANNESGFLGLPGGANYSDGAFGSVGFSSFWWSSTEYDIDYAWFRSIGYSSGNVTRDKLRKQSGFSVRCIKD